MRTDKFVELLNCDFFTGVPDSQLKPLCDYLYQTRGIGKNHIIAANEGNCVALAAGYHMATGKIAAVYMQNSGIGNIINPVTSLISDMVYAIPCIFIVGWRGEPGVHDEPQHKMMGLVTERLLRDADIEALVIDKETTEQEVAAALERWRGGLFKNGKSAAFIIKKGALEADEKTVYHNENTMLRESAVERIAAITDENDVIISTTGKASRELFEIREKNGQPHKTDFLTVGSMGHSSSVALEIALQKPNAKIWCVDGDGAAIMHMGSMAYIGALHPNNYVHIVLNNGAHETVGGMPTAAGKIDLCKIAEGCGYSDIARASSEDELDRALKSAKAANTLCFIEALTAIGSRSDLGRPTETPQECKAAFMERLSGL